MVEKNSTTELKEIGSETKKRKRVDPPVNSVKSFTSYESFADWGWQGDSPTTKEFYDIVKAAIKKKGEKVKFKEVEFRGPEKRCLYYTDMSISLTGSVYDNSNEICACLINENEKEDKESIPLGELLSIIEPFKDAEKGIRFLSNVKK